MGRTYRYDRNGVRTGWSETTNPDDDAKAVGALLLLAISIASLAPIGIGSLYILVAISEWYHLHMLFCIILALIPGVLILYLLYISRIVRYVYFGAEALSLAGFVFMYSRQRTDLIWSSFFCLVTVVVALMITHFVANIGREDRKMKKLYDDLYKREAER